MKEEVREYDFYIKLDKVQDASPENVKIIKQILRDEKLEKEINLIFDSIDLSVSINNITPFDVYYQTRSFEINESLSVLNYRNKQVKLNMYIGAWSGNPRIKNSHISIYTSSNQIGGERFCQIELSDCVEDENYVYILKNISNLAGTGAIARLNKYSLSKELEEKRKEDLHKRREELVERLHSEVINYGDKDWICVYKFDKDKLYDQSYHKTLLYECIESIIKYAFTIENIIIEAKENGTFIPVHKTKKYIYNLPTSIIQTRAKNANKIPNVSHTSKNSYTRDKYIVEYTKRRADGICQLCKNEAPFKDKDNNPYLEVHHIKWLSDGGEDSIENTVALCPNCHRKMHNLNLEEDVNYLKSLNSFEYIKISETPGEGGGPYYNVQIHNSGLVEYDDRVFIKNAEKNLWEIDNIDIQNIAIEINEFGFKGFDVSQSKKEIICCPNLFVEIKYIDGTIKTLDFNYTTTKALELGKNKIDIFELKSRICNILDIDIKSNTLKLIDIKDILDKSIYKLKKEFEFTKLQEKWLQKIEKYILREGTIDKEAFENGNFKREGGFEKYNKIFDDKLHIVIEKLKEHMFSDNELA